MDDKELDKVGYKILTLFLIIVSIFIIRRKYNDVDLLKNEYYTIGKVEKIYHGRGNTTVDFKYVVNGKILKSSSSSFTQNISQIGAIYFVIVNKNNFEQAYILGCCPYDKQKHFVPEHGLDKIPDEALQKKVDEAFENVFNSSIGKLLPPY